MSEVRGINIKQIGKPTYKRRRFFMCTKKKERSKKANELRGECEGAEAGKYSRKSVRKAV